MGSSVTVPKSRIDADPQPTGHVRISAPYARRRPPQRPAQDPAWPALLTRNTPGHAATPAPVLIAQGTADELVAPAATRALAERLCRLGDTVELRTYQDVNHDIVEVASADVVAWIADRLAGRSARSTCRR